MANANRPRGFLPVRSGVSPWSGQANIYYVPSTDTNSYYVGNVVLAATGTDSNGVPTITRVGATGVITAGNFRGVVVGFGTSPQVIADPNNLAIGYIPATKAYAYYVAVCDDPNAIFECTDDGKTTSTASLGTSVGNNIGFTDPSPPTGTPTYGYGAGVLNTTTIATTGTLPFRVIANPSYPNVVAGQPYSTWWVKFNNHDFAGAGGTAP
jgi:hypothetical protein